MIIEADAVAFAALSLKLVAAVVTLELDIVVEMPLVFAAAFGGACSVLLATGF